jgi:hypothetical protein
VAVGADELALSDFVRDTLQPIALANQLSHLGSLLANMVELEDGWIPEPTVCTAP